MTPRLVDIPALETERLLFRAPQASDFAVLEPFIRSDRARYIGGGADKDRRHAWNTLALLCGHWHLRGYGSFVAVLKATGQPVGSMGPWHPITWPEPELGWTIWDPAAEGLGLGFEGMSRLRRHAYEDLGWQTAVSYIDPDNARSIALAARLGCIRDDHAPRVHPEDLVYRHPAPSEVVA